MHSRRKGTFGMFSKTDQHFVSTIQTLYRLQRIFICWWVESRGFLKNTSELVSLSHPDSSSHNETQESHALEVENKNDQCKKGRIFQVKIWLCPNPFLKENRQKWLLLSFWSYTNDLSGMESCKLSIQLIGESLTNKTFIIGWQMFWTGCRIQD